MEIEGEIQYDPNGIARAIIRGETDSYPVAIDADLQRSWCSCAKYVFSNKSCKHIIYLLDNVDYSKMVDMTNKLSRLETGSTILDNLLGGGIPYGSVTTTFGEPQSGKSVFGLQAGLANIAKTGKDTILIETEGMREEDLKSLLYKFMGRFNLTKEIVDEKFKIYFTLGDPELQSVQKLLMMFGIFLTLEISKNGKYSTKFQFCAPTIKEKTMENVSLIILDSLTKPIKDSIGSETQNLPSRSQIVERLFGKLYHTAKLYNLGVIVSHHASIDPTMPFGRDLGKPYGGNPILYNSKYAMEFIDATNKVKEETGFGLEARRVKLLRRPDEPSTGELIPIRLKKDFGFCDS